MKREGSVYLASERDLDPILVMEEEEERGEEEEFIVVKECKPKLKSSDN
jgi:hypothetical protein